jgi:hypothetical protein
MRELGKSANRVAAESSGSDGSSVSQAYVSGLLDGKYRLYRADRSKLRALARGLDWTVNDLVRATGISRDGVGLEPEAANLQRPAQSRRVPKAVAAKGDQEESAFRAEVRPARLVPYYGAGAGPFRDDEESAGALAITDDFLDRYPNGLFFRINGKCMEPDWPEGWFASVIPDPALANRGSVVVVWLADNGRSLKRLYEAREDGDHILYQDNPPPGQGHVVVAPVGSRILGVAIDVRRGRPAPFSLRKMDDAVRQELGND